MGVNYAAIPKRLRDVDHWICYDEKKRPINPRTGKFASPTDSRTWASFTVALAAHIDKHYRGIGFVFTEECGLVGIDFDHIIGDDGTIFPEFADVVASVASYKEVSPSGTGVHIIVAGKKPYGPSKRRNVEMYDRDRYFTVTGNALPGATEDVASDQDAIERIFTLYLADPLPPQGTDAHGEGTPGAMPPFPGEAGGPAPLEDAEILRIAVRSKQGKKVEALLSGVPDRYTPFLQHDQSASAADLALASLFAFYTTDPSQVLRLMEGSGLRREKWYVRHGSDLYILSTIRKALAGTTTHYVSRQEKAKHTAHDAVEAAAPPDEVPTDEEAALAEACLRGDPVAFFLRVFHEEHVGDDVPATCYILSLASQSILNSGGLHVMSTGSSGKGKSHTATTILKQIPSQYKAVGSISDKTLFYHHFNPETVFVNDDRNLSEDLNAIIKDATTHFQESITHRTVVKGAPVVFRSPERCVWWLLKVEGTGDDQTWNRMLCPYVDESSETDESVLTLTLQKATEFSLDAVQESGDLRVAKAMWYLLRRELCAVEIPFAPAIIFQKHDNRRNPEIFIDMIRSFTLLFSRQREHRMERDVKVYIASLDDYRRAKDVFDLLTREVGGQVSKLTYTERSVITYIARENVSKFTLNELLVKYHGAVDKRMTYNTLYRIFLGRQDRNHAGLLEKCPFVRMVDASVTEGEYEKRTKREVQFTVSIEEVRIWLMGLSISYAETIAPGTIADE